MRTAPQSSSFLPHPHAKPRHCEAGAHTGLAIRTILCRGGHPSACQKSLAEFAARRRQRNKIIFSRDMRVRENTSQAASVEFVRLRRTNYARSRLQSFCRKNPEGFSTVSGADAPVRPPVNHRTPCSAPSLNKKTRTANRSPHFPNSNSYHSAAISRTARIASSTSCSVL